MGDENDLGFRTGRLRAGEGRGGEDELTARREAGWNRRDDPPSTPEVRTVCVRRLALILLALAVWMNAATRAHVWGRIIS
jgi:hypothetical protein